MTSPTNFFNSYRQAEQIYQPIARQVPEPNPHCLTDAKIKRIGYAILSQLALLFAGLLVAAAVLTFAATPAGWVIGAIAIPVIAMLILSGGSLYYAITIKDYEDPKELAKMKEKAIHEDFPTLYKAHGPENLVKYIFNEEREELSIQTLREKLNEDLRRLDFQTAAWRYNLNQLKTLGIAPISWVEFTQDKLERLNEARIQFRREAAETDRLYPYRTKKLEGIVRDARGKINWSYTVANLFREVKNKAVESFLFKTASDLGEAAIHLAIRRAAFPAEQQVLYDGEMARITTNLGLTIKLLRDEYNLNLPNHLN